MRRVRFDPSTFPLVEMGDKLSTSKRIASSASIIDDKDDSDKRRGYDERKGSMLSSLPLPFGSRTSLNSTSDSKNNNTRQRMSRGHFQLLRQFSTPSDLDRGVKHTRKTSISLGIIPKSKKSPKKEDHRDVFYPPYVTYEHEIELDRDTYCSYCLEKVYLQTEKVHGCRVCDRTYHALCLRREGLCMNGLSAAALKESATGIGWSCPDCSDLFTLLTDDEKQELINIFRTVANDGGIITRESFIVHRKHTYYTLSGCQMDKEKEQEELELFEEMDRLKTGWIDWWDFVQPMGVRILAQRCARDLVPLLSQREVYKMKQFFHELDKEKDGTIPSVFVQTVYNNWYLSLIKDAKSTTVDSNTRTSQTRIIRRKTCSLIDNGIRTWTWERFLEKYALHILAARPNTVSRRPFTPQEAPVSKVKEYRALTE